MKAILTLLFALAASLPAWASPGPHGPKGEHLDGPAASVTTGSAPRVETFSELFELVGTLSGGELSVLVDRYETNEPVLNGQLEVEVQGIRGKARFHADMGDYAIDDPKLLQALSKPGRHALLFTLVAGEESDLLEGALEVRVQAEDHDHDQHPSRSWLWIAAGALLSAAVAIAVVQRRRTRGDH